MTTPFATLNLDKLSLQPENVARKAPTSNQSTSKFQERRRKEALLRQQQAREKRAALARQLARDSEPDASTADEVSSLL